MLQKIQQDFSYYSHEFKDNYRKGVHRLRTILASRAQAQAFVSNAGGVAVVLGYEPDKPDKNAQELYALLMASPYIDDAVQTFLGSIYEAGAESQDAMYSDSARCLEILHDPVMARAAGAGAVSAGKWIATLAGQSCDAYRDITAVAASATAMNAVAASATAMNAVAANSPAVAAIFRTKTALDIVKSNQSAWATLVACTDGVLTPAVCDLAGIDPTDYADGMTAVAASETAMTAVAASETAMTAVAASETAMTAKAIAIKRSRHRTTVLRRSTLTQRRLRSGTPSRPQCRLLPARAALPSARLRLNWPVLAPDNFADMAAVAASSTAMAAVAASSTAMAAVAASSTAMAAVAASDTAMKLVTASAMCLAKFIGSNAAKTALIDHNDMLQKYRAAIWTAVTGGTDYFTSQRGQKDDDGVTNADITNAAYIMFAIPGGYNSGSGVTVCCHGHNGKEAARASGSYSDNNKRYVLLGGGTFTEVNDGMVRTWVYKTK